jgi:hypothetical protein
MGGHAKSFSKMKFSVIAISRVFWAMLMKGHCTFSLSISNSLSPTLWFGIPPLEAMMHGTAVITSNNAVAEVRKGCGIQPTSIIFEWYDRRIKDIES